MLRTKLGRLRADDPRDEKLYCWQHKEQASLSARSSPGPRISNTPILEERTSLDTLADRLGLLEVTQKKAQKPATPQKSAGSHGQAGKHSRPPMMARPKPKAHVGFCCCFTIPIEEVNPPPRPKPQVLQPPTLPATPGKKASAQYLTPTSSRPRPSLSGPSPASGRSSRHSSTHSGASQTALYLSLIPSSASPQTASLLMSELAKPLSQLDEPGYIYMFWLTPDDLPSAPADAAQDLLAPPARPGAGGRRPSDVIASYAGAGAGGGGNGQRGSSRSGPPRGGVGPRTLLLKIGRATNVQRRLNEWQRQCGYDVSLIRYYPYVSGGSGTGPPGAAGSVSAAPRKMPHSHKVERLIHVELAGAGLRVADREKCGACGREHREWFEVPATREGVQAVDELVRRWVDWDERGLA